MWFDGVGSTWPAKVTPRPWLYFSQVAALFVNAAPKVIDYRAEGWSCSEHRWVEIDVRPYFRIDADNKENRFQRALQFYRKNRNVMRAARGLRRQAPQRGRRSQIGGVRFSSLRLPYPAPGEHVAPFEQRPLASYSGDQKHDWYWTPKSRRAQRCGAPEPATARRTTTATARATTQGNPRTRQGQGARSMSDSALGARMFVGDRFFTWLKKPVPVLRLELVRICAPLAILGFMSSRIAYADEWLGDGGFRVPDLGFADPRQPLYLPALPGWAAWLVALTMVASGLALSLGFHARRAAWLFAATGIWAALERSSRRVQREQAHPRHRRRAGTQPVRRALRHRRLAAREAVAQGRAPEHSAAP